MTYLFYVNEVNNYGNIYYMLHVVPDLSPATVEEAIDLSIQKWKSIIYLTERGFNIQADGGYGTCALCDMFYHQMHMCESCPISERVGKLYCEATPHVTWEEAVDCDDKDGLYEAKQELAFLESLKGE